MSANTFGSSFALTTFGESHGPSIGGVIDGCPAGLILDEAHIAQAMAKRRPGQSGVTSPRDEQDAVEFLSGLFEGKTTGCPIAFIIQNTNTKSKDYEKLKDCFRPGHADYTYQQKFGHRDWRGGGRASARETASRVVAGAVAEQVLTQLGITLNAGLVQMGPIKAQTLDWTTVDDNLFYCPDPNCVGDMTDLIATLKEKGDSIGAKIMVRATGVPAGLGVPVYEKLDSQLASAMMSINAVKAVEIGEGMACVEQFGSQHRDQWTQDGQFASNHAGGILGGISSGQPICVSVAFKPTSSIPKPAQTVSLTGEPQTIEVTGRHDPCVGIRAVSVVKAMLAIVLLDNWCQYFDSQPLKSL